MPQPTRRNCSKVNANIPGNRVIMPDTFTADLRSRRRENPIDRNGNIGSLAKKQATSDQHKQTAEYSLRNNTMSFGKEGHETTSSRRTLSESSAEDVGRTGSRYSGGEMWRNELSIKADSSAAQPEGQEKRCTNSNRKLSDAVDVILRVFLVIIFFKLETMTAFKREIHEEELWLYKNPRRPDIVKGGELLFWVIVAPFLVTIALYWFTKDRRDFRAASWAWTLALCLNGIPTSVLKITVGRPRPDYFYRCFPDGVMVLNTTSSSLDTSILDFNCTGLPWDINEGRKSFPSGHSSFAFASFGFIAYYIGAKLHAFDIRGRGHTWRLCIAVIPLMIALLVAVSRTCDYHHHWQDVTIGGLIGLFAGYISYRQYYPSIFGPDAGKPLIRWPRQESSQYQRLNSKEESEDLDEKAAGDALKRPLLAGKEQSKWY
ncbi:phospholipid phosphatase 5 isoform X1 [Drosophila ficusphila]|uniref:phospholipid phosphatase 5 isoform X1 n=2 Tax=Drosophila ficusphila TaxID=30025 RepID=UPI0007E7D97F|nr:phospholipid phosphatase 5 isoform X1 [Drosophila ficusphila]